MAIGTFQDRLAYARKAFRGGQVTVAEQLTRELIRDHPEHPDTLHLLGLIAARSGDPLIGIALVRKAIHWLPDVAAYHATLGLALQAIGDQSGAVAALEQAERLAPGEAVGGSNRLFALHYLPGVDEGALGAAARQWAARHAAPLASTWRPHRNPPDPRRRLRLGYVSADLRRHPVGYFLQAALRDRDRAAFEVICYDVGGRPDDLTAQLQGLVERWRPAAALGDAALAEQIRADGIDLLVDLGGHTSGNRLLVFARRPAPVQLSWLGYFGTTGLAAMDYVIADRWVLPSAAEHAFTERPLRLPHGYLCYTPPEEAPAVAPPPLLQRGRPTFGCFNKLAKLNAPVIALWAAVLAAVPGSRLCLKDAALGSAAVRSRLRAQFAGEGVTPERLVLLPASPHREYLAAYAQVDVALDPFPFTGGTTTAEALWMGVPVVTLVGDRFAGRMGSSYLHAAGHPEWVAASPDAYVATAARLVADPAALAAIRTTLRRDVAAAPLGDAPAFARHFDHALRSAWLTWCAAAAPGNAR